jgi:ribonuclease-3
MSFDSTSPSAAWSGHDFARPELLAEALAHPSLLAASGADGQHNQRLEFLGDAVLQLVLTEALYQLFPEEREGPLSQKRAALSNGTRLAELAREIDLGRHLRLSTGEEQAGGRERDAALEDALEALIGAIYLDAGLARARDWVLGLYGPLQGRLQGDAFVANPKGRLQELVQPRHGNQALRYESVHVAGEDHAREYEAAVYLLDKAIGRGRGTTKKSAEEAAAQEALAQWTESSSSSA